MLLDHYFTKSNLSTINGDKLIFDGMKSWLSLRFGGMLGVAMWLFVKTSYTQKNILVN